MSACEMGSVNFTSADWIEDTVTSIHGAYAGLHPYIAVALCLAGTLMNVVTVIVLTRPTMQSPINSILSAIAICDIIVMSSVLIFVYHFLIAANGKCDVTDWSRNWAYFLFIHAQATVIFHATSIWLTVLLAQIRVFTIRRATTGPTDTFSTTNTIGISIATLIFVICANIPNFLTFEIVARPSFCTEDIAYVIEENSYMYAVIASEQDCGLLKVAFWTNGILFKVVPCFLLTLSIATLVKIIRDVSKRRKSLAQVMNKKRMPRDHTTPMLVAVLSIFLFAELPQGILHVCNAIFSKSTFYEKIYQPLGDVMDLLSLVNSAVNFIIYCAMSRKFRSVFLQIFLSFLPSHIYRKYIQDWSALADLEISRMRPSGITDTTKTEQLALTSHRVSATSVILAEQSTNGKELLPSKLPTRNHLSVEDPSGRGLSHPRVSFDTHHPPFDARSSLEIHEITLPVPNLNKEERQPKNNQWNPIKAIRSYIDRLSSEESSSPNSPQRRRDIITAETNIPAF